MFRPKGKEETAWMKQLYSEKLIVCKCHQILLQRWKKSRKREMDGTCSTHGRGESCAAFRKSDEKSTCRVWTRMKNEVNVEPKETRVCWLDSTYWGQGLEMNSYVKGNEVSDCMTAKHFLGRCENYYSLKIFVPRSQLYVDLIDFNTLVSTVLINAFPHARNNTH
jgi:hypothetical protein